VSDQQKQSGKPRGVVARFLAGESVNALGREKAFLGDIHREVANIEASIRRALRKARRENEAMKARLDHQWRRENGF
jgi:hypothetical protein